MAGPTAFQANAFQTAPLAFQIGIAAPPNTGIIISAAVPFQDSIVPRPFSGFPVVQTQGAFLNGADLVFDVGIDLSQAFGLELIFTQPNGSQLIESPTLIYGSKLQNEVVIGLFVKETHVIARIPPMVLVPGQWSVQLAYQLPGGAPQLSGIGTFSI